MDNKKGADNLTAMLKYQKPHFYSMKYIAIMAVLALLLTAGCALKAAPEAADTAESTAEPTELSEDLSALDDELAAEDVEIDTAELESLDM